MSGENQTLTKIVEILFLNEEDEIGEKSLTDSKFIKKAKVIKYRKNKRMKLFLTEFQSVKIPLRERNTMEFRKRKIWRTFKLL